jgi:threonine/homoserine/homoserine lactone efflux protein
MCHDIAVPHFVEMGRPAGVVVAFEMMSTVIEHMGAVYLFFPMLPMLGQGRVRAKHHHETEPPMLYEVIHASLSFAAIHWALRLSFLCEMNPLVTLVRHCVWREGWEEMVLALWGQAVGILIAMIYVVNYYSPRKHRRKT